MLSASRRINDAKRWPEDFGGSRATTNTASPCRTRRRFPSSVAAIEGLIPSMQSTRKVVQFCIRLGRRRARFAPFPEGGRKSVSPAIGRHDWRPFFQRASCALASVAVWVPLVPSAPSCSWVSRDSSATDQSGHAEHERRP